MTALNLSWGAATDVGLRRRVNEDSYLASPPVFMVADGMGGHDAGAEASRRAAEAFSSLTGLQYVTKEQIEDAFARAVRSVAEIPRAHAAAGTTLTGATITYQGEQPYWLVLNIGDSRVYLHDARGLAQISVDHSEVQRLIELGALSPADAEAHPQRNIVTKAIGGGSTASPDYWLLPITPGDRLLICSDGLTKELSDDQIRSVLAVEAAPQGAATRLVHEALISGGRDNITAIIVDVDGHSHEVDGETLPNYSDDDVDETTLPRTTPPPTTPPPAPLPPTPLHPAPPPPTTPPR